MYKGRMDAWTCILWSISLNARVWICLFNTCLCVCVCFPRWEWLQGREMAYGNVAWFWRDANMSKLWFMTSTSADTALGNSLRKCVFVCDIQHFHMCVTSFSSRGNMFDWQIEILKFQNFSLHFFWKFLRKIRASARGALMWAYNVYIWDYKVKERTPQKTQGQQSHRSVSNVCA